VRGAGARAGARVPSRSAQRALSRVLPPAAPVPAPPARPSPRPQWDALTRANEVARNEVAVFRAYLQRHAKVSCR
jgi:hypothetical protein